MQQKKIILFLIAMFIAASAWLSYASYRFVDPNVGKNWWVLNFTEPSSNNLNFAIDNHSDQTDFHWKLIRSERVLQEGNAKIEKGTNENIAPIGDFENGKFVIEVTTGQEKREIYKNL